MRTYPPHRSNRRFSRLLLFVFLPALTPPSPAATETWDASDLPAGSVTNWSSQESAVSAALPASAGGNPTKDAEGVRFDGNDALEIAAPANFLTGDTTWTATVVFKADNSAGQGGATRPNNPNPNNPSQWWANAALVGRELPGSNSGDWGVMLNSEDELVLGNGGNPSTGLIWQNAPVAENEWHAVTVTFDGPKKNRTLYLDGMQIRAQQGVAINSPSDTINFGCNILGNANDRAYFDGHISKIILTNDLLDAAQVSTLHESLGYPRRSALAPLTREQGTIALFNGSDFTEWGMSIQNNSGSTLGDDIWSVTAGGIAFANGNYGSNNRQSGLFTLRQDYGNYELTFEYRWTEVKNNGNSGVWLLGGPDFVDSADAFPASIEMQLRKGFEGDLLRKQLYLEAEPGWPTAPDQGNADHRIIRRADPAGNTHSVWHTCRILCEVTPDQGSTIEVWINNVYVNKGINCERSDGYITFQAEGHDIEFRNIQIREFSLTFYRWIERFDLPVGMQDRDSLPPGGRFTNFTNYRLGLDPTTTNVPEILQILGSGTNQTISYDLPVFPSEGSTELKYSSDLIEWMDAPAPVESPGTTTNSYLLNIATDDSPCFYRLHFRE